MTAQPETLYGADDLTHLEGLDAVRKRPVAASGAVAALALFIAREPLMDLAGKLMSSKGKTKPAKPRKAKARKKKVEKVDE